MIEKVKYLNVLVLLTFLVGQFQYAYTSYFCTMKHEQVKAPILTATPVSDNDGDGCEECQGVIPETRGQQIIESNCFKVVNVQKDVVSSFAERAKFNAHVLIAFSFLPVVSYRLSPITCHLSAVADSSPPDLPTLNSNLRI